MTKDTTDNGLGNVVISRSLSFMDSWDPNYIFPLQKIGLGAYFLGVLYLMLSVVALVRLVKICKGTSNWTVTRTFYTFLFVCLLMRGIAFWIISGFEIFNVAKNMFIDERYRVLDYQWVRDFQHG